MPLDLDAVRAALSRDPPDPLALAPLTAGDRAADPLAVAELAARAEERAVAIGDPLLRARFLLDLGRVYERALEDPARALAQVARAQATAAGDPSLSDEAVRLKRALQKKLGGERDATESLSPLVPPGEEDPTGEVAIAAHAADAQAEAAFKELAAAARQKAPDTAGHFALLRLASDVGGFAELARAYEESLERGGSPDVRLLLRRRLARLYRRQLGDLQAARTHCYGVLSDRPGDRRALRVLAALLQRAHRWAELDAALGREYLATAKVRPTRAARIARDRARLAAERLRDAPGAAARFQEAAQAADRIDPSLGVGIRAEAVRTLAALDADPSVIAQAASDLVRAGRTAGTGAATNAAAARIAAAIGGPRGAGLLCELAEAALAQGDRVEGASHLRAAVDLVPADEAVARRLESLYVARAAWRELAEFYRDREARLGAEGGGAARALRADLLARRAELLEDELSDRRGAAEAYGAIVRLTGDPGAAQAQCRLLAAEGDVAGVASALDAAVNAAPDLAAKIQALLGRADFLRSRDELAARADYRRAVAVAPSSVPALAGLAELALDEAECLSAADRLAAALASLPPGSGERAEGVRRLARVEQGRLKRGRAAALWDQLLAERPGDLEAFSRACEHARAGGDEPKLVDLLRAAIAQGGPAESLRRWRHELARTLAALGNGQGALETWREAARLDPADREALLALASHLETAGQFAEAAHALEDAIVATEERVEKAQLCSRVAALYRTKLKNDERAGLYSQRARAFAPPGSVAAPSAPPVLAPAAKPTARPHVPWSEADLRAALRDDPFHAPSHRALFRRAQETRHPDRAFAHAALLSLTGAAGDEERELLDARRSLAAPAPRMPLTPRDRAGLLPPDAPLVAELFGVAGLEVAAIRAVAAKDARCAGYFTVASDPTAQAMAEALFAAVRLLGKKPPEIFVGQTGPAAIDYANTVPPRLVVSTRALDGSDPLPPAVLRFYAARAFASLEPEILPARIFPATALGYALEALLAVSLPAVARPREVVQTARALEAKIPEDRKARLGELAEQAYKTLTLADLDAMCHAAEDAANRCGLILCGDPEAAVQAMRRAGATREAVTSLARWAIDDAYFALRQRLGLAE